MRAAPAEIDAQGPKRMNVPNPSYSLRDTGEHCILVVDDVVDNVTMLSAHLRAKGYRCLSAHGGREALEVARREMPDLILLDIRMPELNGLQVCTELKEDDETSLISIILVTANAETEDIIRGFEIGADDYLIKPYNYMEMLARVRAMLRIRDTQAALDELNKTLEAKVAEQVRELEKVNRLRRFFSAQIVESIVDEQQDILSEHRREITVVFLDLRNFTSFAEQSAPQEVIQTLRDLHQLVGPIIFRYGATLERFTGDGVMVFLGDPEPMEDHALQAVMMGREISTIVAKTLQPKWESAGYDIALGIGVCTGEASLGTIGFEGRMDYAAIGSVTNMAARLCGKAGGGQVLISASTHAQVNDHVATSYWGDMDLKGFANKQPVYEVP
jgi:class 3 adenylate cyclase